MAATAGPLVAFLFPDACLSCGSSVDPRRRHLCPSCWSEVRPVAHAVRLPGDGAGRRPDNTPAYWLLPFEGAPRALIHALKYGRRASVAVALAEIIAPAVRGPSLPAADVIVPVPLHAVRLRERGFNQSALLARALAPLVGVPARCALRRTRATAEQTGLSRARRLTNVARAFGAASGSFDGARVLLLDDVLTTGATLARAADALRRAGARSAVCLAVAGRPWSSKPPRSRKPGETG